jgi:hypothetical protein
MVVGLIVLTRTTAGFQVIWRVKAPMPLPTPRAGMLEIATGIAVRVPPIGKSMRVPELTETCAGARVINVLSEPDDAPWALPLTLARK